MIIKFAPRILLIDLTNHTWHTRLCLPPPQSLVLSHSVHFMLPGDFPPLSPSSTINHAAYFFWLPLLMLPELALPPFCILIPMSPAYSPKTQLRWPFL